MQQINKIATKNTLTQPNGLLELLHRLQSELGGLPIVITENGAAFDDTVNPDGSIEIAAKR